MDYVANVLFPKLESLKSKYFKSHPDDPVILHRKEIINKKERFEALHDLKISSAFDSDLLSLLKELEVVVLTVVLDKKEHKEQYTVWRYDPYHYCLRILVERFVLFLEAQNIVGDVMIESRGGKEDIRLKKSFKKIYDEGTEFVPVDKFHKLLTSCQLKVKPKSNNIAGLQIADIIAYPAYQRILFQRGRIEKVGQYGEKIITILENDKYYRGKGNKLWGYGKKWLP